MDRSIEMTAKAIPIETARRQDELPKQYRKGRICVRCQKAILSIWNPGPCCYKCDDEQIEQIGKYG